MRKFGIILAFLIFSNEAFASPARFGGFSYNKDEFGRVVLNEASEAFNEGPAQLEEEPDPPYYLDESDLPVQSQDKYKLIYTMEDVYNELEANEKKSEIRYTPQKDRYKTPPIYSEKSLHEKKNGLSDDDSSSGDDESEEENEEDEE